MSKTAFYVFFPALLFLSPVHAGTSPKKITSIRVMTPPVLDGWVNDTQWSTATPVSDFTQYDPNEGASPTERTSVRIFYDDRSLYVGVICYDTQPGEIVRQLTRRDRSTEADRFTVQIDSYHDHQTAFVFSTNVSGVQSDGFLSQGGTVYDDIWDAVWSVATQTYTDGWSAEFEIPYSALRFTEHESEEYEWGINFRRYISRKHETDEWVMVPRSETLLIPKWGHVGGIANIKPPLHLNLLPYVSGRSSFQTSTSGMAATSKLEGTGGLDLKYGVTRNFTIDAAVNPDYGQVEVDRAVLNLTVFETLFPEKRPFFVEGSHFFAFGSSVDNTSLPLFFSRRIGKRPSGSVTAPPGGVIEENPQTTTILSAAKLSGQTESGFSMGMVAALTDIEEATIKDSSGHVSTVRIEPLGSYNVLRLKQEIGANSWFGGIVTLASREALYPSLSTGIDWNLRLGDATYALDGYFAGARASDPAVERNGTAGRLLFSRLSNEHWFYTTSYDFYSRFFDCNDIGFFAQPRDYGGYTQLIYRENFANGIVKRYSAALNPEYRWNWDGVITHAVLNMEGTAEFTNFWLMDFTYAYSHPAYDDAERGIIGIYKRPAGHAFQLSVTTDQRKDVSVRLTSSYSVDVKKKRSVIEQLAMTLRPVPWMELTPVVVYSRTRNEEAWMFPYGSTPSVTGVSNSLFGDRDVDQLDLELRGIITFTKNLSLQFFSQILIARGRYVNYRALVSSTDFVPYAISTASFINPDFNEVTFNANVLLRWEYLPGSTLYLVWTQGRFDDSGMYESGFGRRFKAAFSLPHEDILLLKASYWLPL